jgi:hypothetical protein
VPRFVFVAYYPEGPHAGPITIGLFGVQDGALLPLFSTREKAIDFAVRVLGTPPQNNENWDGVELPAEDLIQFLHTDASISYVAANPLPSGEVELIPTRIRRAPRAGGRGRRWSQRRLPPVPG